VLRVLTGDWAKFGSRLGESYKSEFSRQKVGAFLRGSVSLVFSVGCCLSLEVFTILLLACLVCLECRLRLQRRSPFGLL
jgi:hypothetical protein